MTFPQSHLEKNIPVLGCRLGGILIDFWKQFLGLISCGKADVFWWKPFWFFMVYNQCYYLITYCTDYKRFYMNGHCLRMFKVPGKISLNQQTNNNKKYNWQNDKAIRYQQIDETCRWKRISYSIWCYDDITEGSAKTI